MIDFFWSLNYMSKPPVKITGYFDRFYSHRRALCIRLLNRHGLFFLSYQIIDFLLSYFCISLLHLVLFISWSQNTDLIFVFSSRGNMIWLVFFSIIFVDFFSVRFSLWKTHSKYSRKKGKICMFVGQWAKTLFIFSRVAKDLRNIFFLKSCEHIFANNLRQTSDWRRRILQLNG